MNTVSSTSARQNLSDEQLSAFADGQLPRRHAQYVAAQIRRNPEYADRIHGYWRREAALYQALHGVDLPGKTLPETTGRRRFFWLATGSAASILLAMGLWLAWPQTRSTQPVGPDYISAALNAYRSATPLPDSQGQRSIPPFVNLGLTPAGHQVLQVANQQLHEYRFHGPQDQRLALYEISNAGQEREGWLHILASGQIPVVEWYSKNNRYLLVGAGSTQHLTQLAVDMQQMLETPSQPQAAPQAKQNGVPPMDAATGQGNGTQPTEPMPQPGASPATMDM